MKPTLRRQFLQVRRSLSPERRKEAAGKLFAALIEQSASFGRTASFFSMRDEIDLSSFNGALAREHRLLLPRAVPDGLDFYLVTNLERQLIPQGHYLFEPNPSCCEQIALAPTDLLLVPGIAFDARGHRLGFGKGHYDRFLARHPLLYSLGVGFKEQLSDAPLPIDPSDQPVNTLFLF